MPDTPSPTPEQIAHAQLQVLAAYGSFFVQDDTARRSSAGTSVTASNATGLGEAEPWRSMTGWGG
jgi:hypothetical protein